MSMDRPAFLVAALLVMLAVALPAAMAGPAQATTFDSTHEPAPLSNPGVTTPTSSLGWPEPFEVALAIGLTCPAGQPGAYTVTFADPTGSTSILLLDPCAGIWQNVTVEPGKLDFFTTSTNGYAGIPGAVAGKSPSVGFTPVGATPFMYQVTGPSGIIAQGAMTATFTPPEEIDQNREIDRFINICIDGNHELRSKNGGDLYCEVGGHINYAAGGWPTPPPVPPKPNPELTGLRMCERPNGPGAFVAASPSVSCRTARFVRSRLFGRAFFSTRPTPCENRTYCVVMGFRCYGQYAGHLRPFSYAHHASCRSGRRRILLDIG
jgi:hypothetical protein